MTLGLSDNSVRQMKTVTLRDLVRETRKVKRITSTGASFLVTDNGKPLWKVSPAEGAMEEGRVEAIDTELEALLAEPKSDLSLADLVAQSRR